MMTVMEDAIMEVDITVLMDAADAHTSNFCINSKKNKFCYTGICFESFNLLHSF